MLKEMVRVRSTFARHTTLVAIIMLMVAGLVLTACGSQTGPQAHSPQLNHSSPAPLSESVPAPSTVLSRTSLEMTNDPQSYSAPALSATPLTAVLSYASTCAPELKATTPAGDVWMIKGCAGVDQQKATTLNIHTGQQIAFHWARRDGYPSSLAVAPQQAATLRHGTLSATKPGTVKVNVTDAVFGCVPALVGPKPGTCVVAIVHISDR